MRKKCYQKFIKIFGEQPADNLSSEEVEKIIGFPIKVSNGIKPNTALLISPLSDEQKRRGEKLEDHPEKIVKLIFNQPEKPKR